jgi:hypothetical protein
VDSKRAMTRTFVTLTTAAAAITGAAAIARAEAGEAEPPQDPAVRTRTWTTSAQPKVVAKPMVRARTPKGRNKGIALDQVVQRAWSFREFRCLDNLWTRESNWNHRAYNSSSGAYGIPQALPAGKMRGAGRDWKSNPETQIRWGLAYIKGRYGRPCGAWGHFRSHNWY